jgi:hypothetical protein
MITITQKKQYVPYFTEFWTLLKVRLLFHPLQNYDELSF